MPTSASRTPSRKLFITRTASEEFVKQLNKSKEPLHPKPIAFRKETREKLDDKDIEVHVEVVMQYNDSYNDQVLCYTNTIHNPDGGAHLSGFRSALTRAINQYAKSNELLKEKDPANHRRRRARRFDGGDFGEAQRSEV